MNQGEFSNRIDYWFKRIKYACVDSAERISCTRVLAGMDEIIKEARKEFVVKLKQENDLRWIPDWFEKWFGT